MPHPIRSTAPSPNSHTIKLRSITSVSDSSQLVKMNDPNINTFDRVGTVGPTATTCGAPDQVSLFFILRFFSSSMLLCSSFLLLLFIKFLLNFSSSSFCCFIRRHQRTTLLSLSVHPFISFITLIKTRNGQNV